MVVPVYLTVAVLIIIFVSSTLGRAIFPTVDAGQFTLRMRAPAGTRIAMRSCSSPSPSATGSVAPMLMTSCAMIAGMLPMAIGLGEGGSQTAPLGRAVIGGLTGGTIATLIILPAIFAILQGERTRKSASLLPADLTRATKLELHSVDKIGAGS
jgi:multidrug efflux pump subunit AcrB